MFLGLSTVFQNPAAVLSNTHQPVADARFKAALNNWAMDLYQDFSKVRSLENKNFVFFTPNLLASFSMLYAGAPSELQKTMEKALHMGELTKENWHTAFNAWSQNLVDRSKQLHENKPIFHFQQLQMVASHVDAPLTEEAAANLSHYNAAYCPFSDPHEAGEFVNNKVEEVTEGMIKDLVSPQDLSGDLVLLMASAALFKGQWEYPFATTSNSKETFYNCDGSEAVVEMMNQGLDNLKRAYDYVEGSHRMQILELPFHGNISLLLMKPNRWGDSPAKNQLTNYMTQKNIQGLLDNFDARFTESSALSIGIPKLDLTDKLDVLEELKHTPLAQAIKTADFTGSLIKSGPPTKTPKLVSEVHFTMDEEGAKVAGASYSPTYRESCDPCFKLDGPFGMALIDRSTQTILGMGQILKLESKS